MTHANRLWGPERIRGELLKLGLRVCKRTVQKYMRGVRPPRPSSPRWGTFLREHTEVPPFVAKVRELSPQHFAMAYLGLITELRPSTLRPLRRSGPEYDADWNERRLRVRRSHTGGEEQSLGGGEQKQKAG
jgi:hypothetical protein